MNEKEKTYCKMFGKALRDLRVAKTGKSSILFAYENDIPKSTLTRIERGENEAQLITLKKIAEAFGWSMEELFKHIEENIPKDFKIFDDEHY
ncbi:MAG TPA: hypothetical protein DCS44_06495 [Cyanobacteria bacterium UBA10660]|nr:MAG TPA: hypothetical protein CPT83_01250 [Candidatus Gastranaerophilales bacterium HUM_1]HAS94244.1 hypothetical protein [Cyanobacteria bacterium UBA10660]